MNNPLINPHGEEVQGDISKCPYHQMMQKRKAQEEEEQKQQAKCPVADDTKQEQSQTESKCPIDHKNLSQEQLEELKNQMPSNHPTTSTTKTGGKCPMGFDSVEYAEANAMDPMTHFMCPICNTFSYQPIVFLNCQHCICKFCLEKQDKVEKCPRCNEPIKSKEQDSYRQFLISSYMETEWAHHFVNQVLKSSEINPYSLIEAKDDVENEMENEDKVQQRVSKGTYYFQMGIEAQRGGNIESAMARCLMGLSLLNRFRKLEDAKTKSTVIQQYFMEACNIMGVLYGYMSDLIVQRQQPSSLSMQYVQQSCDILRSALQASLSVDQKYKSEIAMSFSTSLIKLIGMSSTEKSKELIEELLKSRREYLLTNPAQEIAYAKLVFNYKEQLDAKELEFTKQMLEKRYTDATFIQRAHPSMKQEFEQLILQL